MVRGPMFTAETRPRHGLEPEERLLLAVLEQAVADLSDRSPAVRADADAYLFSEGSGGTMFSFDAICDYFQLSPAAVRVALRTRFWQVQPEPSAATREPSAVVHVSSPPSPVAAEITSEPPQTSPGAHDWTATRALLESTDSRAAPLVLDVPTSEIADTSAPAATEPVIQPSPNAITPSLNDQARTAVP